MSTSGEEPITVVVADDAALFREGVVRLLRATGFVVKASVGDVPALEEAVERYRPMLAIVDVRMPPSGRDEGLHAANRLRARHPGLGILILSHYVSIGPALELLRHDGGGVGYLLKEGVADSAALLAAARHVAHGGAAIDPAVSRELIARRGARDPLSELTPRELEVLGLMAQGESNRGIAGALVVGERTVETHVTNIFGKLGLVDGDSNRRVRAVLAFLNAGEATDARPA